jgi:serine/threonine protein kinase, bacterial
VSSLRASFEEHGDLFIVQDYIEGRTLEKILNEEGCYTDTEVVRFLRDLLPVIHFVHEHGVIHRDIKPQNVMASGRSSPLTLIDFGVVKLLETGCSATSVAVMSLGYTSPEQSLGRPVPASDLFSVGRTAVFLLTGKNPDEFVGPNTSRCEWHRFATVFRPLAEIINRLIEPDLNRRFRSAQEVMDALSQQEAEHLEMRGH